jgi:hypothetical protein
MMRNATGKSELGFEHDPGANSGADTRRPACQPDFRQMARREAAGRL